MVTSPVALVRLMMSFLPEWHGVLFIHSGPFREGIFKFTLYIPDRFVSLLIVIGEVLLWGAGSRTRDPWCGSSPKFTIRISILTMGEYFFQQSYDSHVILVQHSEHVESLPRMGQNTAPHLVSLLPRQLAM